MGCDAAHDDAIQIQGLQRCSVLSSSSFTHAAKHSLQTTAQLFSGVDT